MSFRIRLLISFLLAALAPVLILAWIVRGEMTKRLTEQFERRIGVQTAVIEGDLARQSEAIAGALRRLESAMLEDDRFRRAIENPDSNRSYVLDYAGDALGFTGLSVLQIQDEKGRIISSGHFRNEYDRLEPELPGRLLILGEAALIRARSPEGEFIALARSQTVSMAGRNLSLVGGLRVEDLEIARLYQNSDIQVLLDYPVARYSTQVDSNRDMTGRALIRRVPVQVIDTDASGSASFIIVHSLEELTVLQASLSRWFRLIGLLTGLLAAAGALWLSGRISRPLSDLAEKTAMVDLDRLDVDFRSRRRDEFGALSRLLGEMTLRLRKSIASVKEAERKAAIGELARQVNHDIKNGLTPLRNVFRHLFQVASDTPAELPGVLLERQETLDTSMSYLQNLAANYSRLSPKMERVSIDLNAMLNQIARDLRGIERGRIATRLAERAIVRADELSVRRIVENLVDNAFDSLPEGRGLVTLTTETFDVGSIPFVRFVVADEGVGMTPEQIEAAFADFHTTKEHGTGLGLSIVRRLVMDLNGTIRVESTPGEGSRFIVELPAA